MEVWIIIAISLIISSVILYLFVRKANEMNVSIDMQNMAFFILPAFIIGMYNLLEGKSFLISKYNLLIIIFASIFFGFLGNIASLKALKLAPNQGYSLIISKSYVLITATFSVWLFDSILTIKSIIAIILIVLFSTLVIIDKKDKKTNSDSNWIWLTFAAFFSWGFLALTLKYLVTKGLDPTIILFYLMSIVSIIIGIQLFIKKEKFEFKTNWILIFLLIGIASTFFNLFIILGYKYAPNPGYINASNAGSIALVTIFSALIFKDEFNIKKFIGVVGIIGSLILLFI